MIKQPSPAEVCLILQSNPLQKKWSKVKKTAKSLQKSKSESVENPAGQPFAEKVGQS